MTGCGRPASRSTCAGAELRGGPGVDRVGLFAWRVLAAGEGHEVAVGVAAHEHDVVQRGQPVEDLHGLRPGRVVAAHHDPVGPPDVWFREHRVEHRQHAVNVGQDSDGLDHAVILAPAAGHATRDPLTAARSRLDAEPVPGGAERIALGVGEHLDGGDGEHHRLAAPVGAAEAAAAGGELPAAVPFGGERLGDSCEHGVVGDLNRVAFNDHVQSLVPPVAAGGQYHVRIGAQVGELLLLRAGGKPDGLLGPRRDDRGDVRPAIGPDGGEPEQLGGFEHLAGVLPSGGGRGRVAVLLIERGDWRGHRHLSNHGRPAPA